MDLIIWGVGYVASNQLERLRQFRSPRIPSWESPPLAIAGLIHTLLDGDTGPVLTEHGLNIVHETWQTRHAALWLRYRALKDAQQKGLIGCWAGMCTPETMSSTKEAVEEARWVTEHLTEALDWCKERKLRKLPFGQMVKARRNVRE